LYEIETNKMNCEICFEPFDHSAHKPYSLSSCPHTYCTICLDRLTSNKCPQCSKQIIGKNVNIQLLKLIPKSEYDKITVLLNYFDETLIDSSEVCCDNHDQSTGFIDYAEDANKLLNSINNLQHFNVGKTVVLDYV